MTITEQTALALIADNENPSEALLQATQILIYLLSQPELLEERALAYLREHA